MLKRNRLSVAIAALFTIASSLAAPRIELVSAEDHGAAWPFVAEEMHLLCLPGDAVVASDPETGRMYALNGSARAQAQRLALEPLDSVWADNPEIPGTRVSVGQMIEKGLSLCAD